MAQFSIRKCELISDTHKVGSCLIELYHFRHHSIAAPVARSWHLLVLKSLTALFKLTVKVASLSQRLRLIRGPTAYLLASRILFEKLIWLIACSHRDCALNTNLNSHLAPPEKQGHILITGHLFTFLRAITSLEDKAILHSLWKLAQVHAAAWWLTLSRHSCQRHWVRFADLIDYCLLKPLVEHYDRVLGTFHP